MKYFLATTLLLLSTTILAQEYSAGLNVKRIRVHMADTYVSTSPEPKNTCSSWGEYFKFDHKTESGKAFLSLLLAAKVSGKPIQAWYTTSSAIGTNQTNGCNTHTTSILIGVSIP